MHVTSEAVGSIRLAVCPASPHGFKWIFLGDQSSLPVGTLAVLSLSIPQLTTLLCRAQANQQQFQIQGAILMDVRPAALAGKNMGRMR